MLTTETYSRAFWNSIRSKNTADSILEEAVNRVNGSYFLPEASAEKYAAALAKENLFRRIATFVMATTSGGRIITSDTPVDADWVGEGGTVPEAELTANRTSLNEHKLACISVLDSNFVHDTGFNISDYLIRDFARICGKRNKACRIRRLQVLLGRGASAAIHQGTARKILLCR